MDLIDLQAIKNGSYHYIMHYVEYLTKCNFLQPLKSKTASEISHELLIILLDIGAPHVLQSDNGCEFNYHTNNAKTFPHVASIGPCKCTVMTSSHRDQLNKVMAT